METRLQWASEDREISHKPPAAGKPLEDEKPKGKALNAMKNLKENRAESVSDRSFYRITALLRSLTLPAQ